MWLTKLQLFLTTCLNLFESRIVAGATKNYQAEFVAWFYDMEHAQKMRWMIVNQQNRKLEQFHKSVRRRRIEVQASTAARSGVSAVQREILTINTEGSGFETDQRTISCNSEFWWEDRGEVDKNEQKSKLLINFRRFCHEQVLKCTCDTCERAQHPCCLSMLWDLNKAVSSLCFSRRGWGFLCSIKFQLQHSIVNKTDEGMTRGHPRPEPTFNSLALDALLTAACW